MDALKVPLDDPTERQAFPEALIQAFRAGLIDEHTHAIDRSSFTGI
ncbi:MAG: hypothetical protein NTV52_28000 [Acidobacteria bacterium]|nr:hypothetical protein [Acidobacteriota bacterium]